jgi:hypothetical protein
MKDLFLLFFLWTSSLLLRLPTSSWRSWRPFSDRETNDVKIFSSFYFLSDFIVIWKRLDFEFLRLLLERERVSALESIDSFVGVSSVLTIFILPHSSPQLFCTLLRLPPDTKE